jgi:hypothetical protein
MLELKVFVQESVHSLDDDALRVLCDTLRVDSRGCDDRRDIERVLTGLLCLDKDTTLGTFLTWLRTRETQTHASGLVTRKNAFLNTFVPVISPRRAASETPSSNSNPGNNAVKDHHLNDEITARLEELKLLEQDFKDAERQVHSGSPSFEKLKAFLVKLTKLRAKEVDVRSFFIQQSKLLTQQHAQMKEEALHTRAQLDFFVDGFTNLRRRHDELVEKSTQMKAENETAHDVFLSITAQESHFGLVLHRTMLAMIEEKRELTQQLRNAHEEIRTLKDKQQQLEQLVSRLKQQRGDALKDANSYKQQLRKCKQKMETLATEGPDCAYFRQQSTQLRGSLMTLLTLFRESIVKDTKSSKQSLSKEVVRAVQKVLLASPPVGSTSSRKKIQVAGAASVDEPGGEPGAVARVVEKSEVAGQDVDEVVRGVVLLGGQDEEAASCATALCTKLRYVPIDLKGELDRLREENERRAHAPAASTVMDGTATSSASPALAIAVPPAPPTVENYLLPLKVAIVTRQREKGAKGAVLYNYELTACEANLLIGCGLPIDSIIDMKIPPPLPPPPSAQPTTLVQSSNATLTKAPSSPSRGTANATARPASKATPTPSSLSRSSSRQQTPVDTKRPTPKPTPLPGSRPTTKATSPAKPVSKPLDRRAAFASMPQKFAQLAPVVFVEDRVDLIMQEIVRQKRVRTTPVVVWDDATSQVNESLLMYAEDVQMMIWTEQDNRKPKKPSQETSKPNTPASSSRVGGSSPTRTGASLSTTRKTLARAPAKGKATSPTTRSPSKPGSPTRQGTEAKTISPVKPSTAKPASPARPKAAATSSPPKRKA